MQEEYNENSIDLARRVPVSIRIPVVVKQELMQCAFERGVTVTDILEVLIENPRTKLLYNFDEILSDNIRFKGETHSRTKEIEKSNLKIKELELSKGRLLAAYVDACVKEQKVRIELKQLKEKYGIK